MNLLNELQSHDDEEEECKKRLSERPVGRLECNRKVGDTIQSRRRRDYASEKRREPMHERERERERKQQ